MRRPILAFAGRTYHIVGNLMSRPIYPSLVLVKPRKTRPCLTERLLMGRKEQTNKLAYNFQIKLHFFL